MRKGFTLIEVVVALVILEIGVLGAAGTLVLAAATMTRAEALERAVAATEGVLDSLAFAASGGRGAKPFRGGEVVWFANAQGHLVVNAMSHDADTLLVIVSAVASR